MKTNNKNIPALRFPEFKEDWENNVLGNIATFSKGKGLSKSDITPNGQLECIRYGELYTDYGEVIREVKSKTNVNASELVLSETNDVIIPASGETQLDIATASCVLKNGIALGGDLNIIKSKLNGIYLAYYLNNKRKIDIAKLSQGISVVHLYSSQLQTLTINIPKKEEQQKIADFLTAVDDKIQQLTKKKNLLEQYKKGVMQKLFSQQLRFKDDKGKDFPDWEEKRFNEIFNLKYGKDYKHLDVGEIPVFGSGGIMTFVNKSLYNKPSVLIGRKGTIDKPRFINSSFWTVDTMFYTEIMDNYVPYFVYLLVLQINWYKYNEATGVPSLNTTSINAVKVFTPTSIMEQKKIANYIKFINDKIELVQAQIDKTKEFKKGLLQQMFV